MVWGSRRPEEGTKQGAMELHPPFESSGWRRFHLRIEEGFGHLQNSGSHQSEGREKLTQAIGRSQHETPLLKRNKSSKIQAEEDATSYAHIGDIEEEVTNKNTSLLLQVQHLQATKEQASVLRNLFINLNSSSALHGWSSLGMDPCGESWMGVQCVDSAVTEIKLSRMALVGSLGYMLDQLSSLTVLDFSNNNIGGNVPYELPPNLQNLNLAENNFSGGNLPYSISMLTDLRYLNVSCNHLSGTIADMFQKLSNLSTLDLSRNNLTGVFPESFSNLSSLSTLWVKNNSLSGDLNALATLPLQNLNVAYNNFNGSIPTTLRSIRGLEYTGNNFNTTPLPLSPKPQDKPSHDNGSTSSYPTAPPESGFESFPEPHVIPQTNPHGTSMLATRTIAGIAVACGAGMMIVIVFLFSYLVWRVKEDVYGKDHLNLYKIKTAPSKEDRSMLGLPFTCTICRRQKDFYGESHNASDEKETEIVQIRRDSGPSRVHAFSLAELQEATNQFSQEHLISESVFGPRYLAKMSNREVFTVKKLDIAESCVCEDSLMERLSKISQLHHTNIDELLGFCVEHGNFLLIYKYYDGGTLNGILHSGNGGSNQRDLSWNVRVKIALGTARALEHLHEFCSSEMVHKYLTSENIALDEDLNPHLSNCGVAEILPRLEEKVSTQSTTASFGYSAPESLASGLYSVKSDVYSFGVLMLELLTGRKPYDRTRPRSEQSLLRWAVPHLHDFDSLTSIGDPTIRHTIPPKSLSRFADITTLCLQPEPEFRPPMSDVVQSLINLMRRESLSNRRYREEHGTSYSHST